MNWFLLALCAPFLWSLINHCDKFILSRYFKGGGGGGGLMIFVGLISFPIALFIYIFDHSVLNLSTGLALSFIGSGIFYNLAVIFYLFALEREDASYIVPFWQLAPIFTYFLGVIFLGEYLESTKIIASLVTICGAVLLSLKLDRGILSIKTRTVTIMVLSSLAIALESVLFRESEALNIPFAVSMFWNQVGFVIFGLVCFFVPKFKKEFLDVVRLNSINVLGLNIFEQVMEIVGVIFYNISLLVAPYVAVVVLLSYTAQPLFVFVEGIFLTLLFPEFIEEDIDTKTLTQKLISIIIMGVGIYFVIR